MLNAILEVGAIARFADVTDDLTLDPAALAALVTPRTRAVLPVHLYGLPAAMGEISAVARQPAVRADSSPPATMRSRPGSARLDRDQLAQCLDAEGIDAVAYYPKLVHEYPATALTQVVADEASRIVRDESESIS